MSLVYQKNGKGPWYADLRHVGGGQRSTRCRDHRAALALARQWERDAVAGKLAVAGGAAEPAEAPRLVGEALQHLADTTQSRSSHYTYRLRHLARLLGEVPLSDLGLVHITEYIAKRQAEEASDSTIEKERKALGRALVLARRAKMWSGIVEDIMPDDWSPKIVKRTRWLTAEEVGKLLPQLEPDRQLWVQLAIYLGARAHGVTALRWSDIDWTRGTAHLHETKTAGAERVVPIPAPLLRILLAAWQSPYVGLVVQPWGNDCRDLEGACKRAGIVKVTPNDLRRTYASWLANTGASTAQVATLLGHATEDMARTVYVQHDRAVLAEAAGQMPEAPAVGPTLTAKEKREAGQIKGKGGRPKR